MSLASLSTRTRMGVVPPRAGTRRVRRRVVRQGGLLLHNCWWWVLLSGIADRQRATTTE